MSMLLFILLGAIALGFLRQTYDVFTIIILSVLIFGAMLQKGVSF
jgi:hypothetical protein